jgi:hypothetical protein
MSTKKGREFCRVSVRPWAPARILGPGDKPASSTRGFRSLTPHTCYLEFENSCGHSAPGSRDGAIPEARSTHKLGPDQGRVRGIGSGPRCGLIREKCPPSGGFLADLRGPDLRCLFQRFVQESLRE